MVPYHRNLKCLLWLASIASMRRDAVNLELFKLEPTSFWVARDGATRTLN